MLREIKDNKKIRIIAQTDFLKDYKDIPDNDNFLVEAETGKDAVSKACDSAFDNDLTICHVQMAPEDGKKWKSLSKMTMKLWSHTSENGMFITVWNGSKDQNAFVGIALKKQPTWLPLFSF